MERLDTTDLKILRLLQDNARLTIKEIAKKLNLSTTPIFDRMKRMEKEKIIDRYVAIVNPEKVGKSILAFVHISLKEHARPEVEVFVKQVIEFKEVMECFHLTGDADFVLKVSLDDMKSYNEFVLDKLSIVKNIAKLETRFCLSVRKYSTALPV